MSADDEQVTLKYDVDETPPIALSAALGLQIVVLIIAGIVLTPVVVLRVAGDPGNHMQWVVFAAMVISGLTTMIQARPIGRFGAGYVLFMGTSGAFIAISVDAVQAGGLPLLAALVLFSALIQFAFSFRLGYLRRIVTPTVGGTVIMLIAVTVFPTAFKLINAEPETIGQASLAGPITATMTFVVILAVSMFAKGALKLWGPLVGTVIGCALAYSYGIFDLSRVADAAWIGLPEATWPGIDLSFGPDFWWLLIPFAIVTVVGAIETYGDGIAIQRLSRRTREPIDFRAVQGAVNADGLGNFLSGLMGTLPNTTYSTSISVVDLTGVAARQVCLFGGFFLILIGFCPKISMLLQSIPDPVAGAYIMILLVLLFAHGLRLVTEDGMNFENGLIVCVSFWLAVGFQNQQIFPDHLPEWSRGMLDNGMTAGGIIALVLTALVSLKRSKVQSLQVPATMASIPDVHEFLATMGSKAGWDKSALTRLELAAEEAMIFLIERAEGPASARAIRLSAKAERGQIELEFIGGSAGSNLEQEVSAIDTANLPTAADTGLRILKGLARRVVHQQFHGMDVMIVTMDSRPL